MREWREYIFNMLRSTLYPAAWSTAPYWVIVIRRDRLQKLGYRVDLAPVEYPNYCVLEMCGHEIFRCNIQNLLFNMPHYLDPVCQRAVAACVESTVKFTRASTYLWLWNLLNQEMFRSDHGPKNHWPKNLNKDLKRFATCLDCAKCCNILVSRNK